MEIVTEIPSTGLIELIATVVFSLSALYVAFIVYAIVFHEIIQAVRKEIMKRRKP